MSMSIGDMIEAQSFSSLMVDLLQDKSVSLFRNEKSNKYKSSLLSLLSLSTYSRIFLSLDGDLP